MYLQVQDAIQHFEQTVICRKNGLGFGYFPELAVESFNGICGVNQPAELFRELSVLTVAADRNLRHGAGEIAEHSAEEIAPAPLNRYHFFQKPKSTFPGHSVPPPVFFLHSVGWPAADPFFPRGKLPPFPPSSGGSLDSVYAECCS